MYTNTDTLEVIEGATVNIQNNVVSVKGKLGEEKISFGTDVLLKIEGKSISIGTKKKEMLNTVKTLIKNLMNGVTKGYEKKMKVVFAHFPATLEVKGNIVKIKNFLGEKCDRKAKIIGNTKVSVKGQDVTITGPNKEFVGQTAANIRTATRIKNKDCRVFQDGIYPVE